jgi:hypothetical protein
MTSIRGIVCRVRGHRFSEWFFLRNTNCGYLEGRDCARCSREER